jgi:hypothetical protein
VAHNRRRKKGIISEAFYIMELPIRFAVEVVNDFINDTVFFISGKRRSRVSTNY